MDLGAIIAVLGGIALIPVMIGIFWVFARLSLRKQTAQWQARDHLLGAAQHDTSRASWGPGVATNPAQEIRLDVLVGAQWNPANYANQAYYGEGDESLGNIAKSEVRDGLLGLIPGYDLVSEVRDGVQGVRELPGDIRGMGQDPIGEEMRASQEHNGATYVFDPVGIRLFWPGKMNFALAWQEISRVALQVVFGREIVTTQIVVWPVNPAGWGATRPEFVAMQGFPQVAVLPAGTLFRVDPAYVETARRGLLYAGPRFAGQVEEIGQATQRQLPQQSPPPPLPGQHPYR